MLWRFLCLTLLQKMWNVVKFVLRASLWWSWTLKTAYDMLWRVLCLAAMLPKIWTVVKIFLWALLIMGLDLKKETFRWFHVRQRCSPQCETWIIFFCGLYLWWAWTSKSALDMLWRVSCLAARLPKIVNRVKFFFVGYAYDRHRPQNQLLTCSRGFHVQLPCCPKYCTGLIFFCGLLLWWAWT